MKFRIFLIILVLFSFCSIGRPKNYDVFYKNYIISLKAGTSMVVTEYKRDFSGFVNEMNHLPGFTFSAGVAKTISKDWDFGFEYEQSSFHGFQNNPDFSAYRFGHYKISLMRIEPVIYKTEVQNFNFVLTYHFNFNVKRRVIPFVYLKGGPTKLTSYLMYKSTNEIIFAKIGRDETKPNSSLYVDNFNVGVGFGNEFIIDSKLSLNIQADLNIVNDDNLDAVHNFNAPPPEGYKNFVSGLYGRIMISASYNIHPTRQQIFARKYRLKSFNNKKTQKRQIIPWYRK